MIREFFLSSLARGGLLVLFVLFFVLLLSCIWTSSFLHIHLLSNNQDLLTTMPRARSAIATKNRSRKSLWFSVNQNCKVVKEKEIANRALPK